MIDKDIQQNEENIAKEIREKKEKAKEDPILGPLLKRKKRKRFKKSIWVTWLAKLMAGDLSCYWELWFKSNFINYEKIPESTELAKWHINHSRMLYELRKERLAAGEEIFVEGKNRFGVEVKPGIFLEGQPDLITISEDNVTMYDCKTGEQKTSHQIQLMIYMYYVFHYLNKYPNLNPKGCLRYNQGFKVEVPDTLIDEKFIKNLNYFIAILSGEEPPIKAPGKFECKYCNITKEDCPERID